LLVFFLLFSFFCFFVLFFVLFFADARLRARLHSNNGLLVSQQYSLMAGVWANQPVKTLSA